MDFLGLRTLSVISNCLELVKKNRGIEVEFDETMDDPEVYKLWQEGKTFGIFQFESAGITSFMKDLKPDCLEDIVAGVSLYRPGPMDQIPRYIKGKLNPGHNEYTHPALEPILNVTYGCMVYQEQVMQIVRDLAGYSLGRADLVRRAMGKKKLDVMAKEREVFINGQVDENGNVIVPGCVRNGIDAESANKIFDEMAEFAKYAFNKSHAAAYAVLSYRTAYLKAYYKEELMAATLNSFLGNLDKIPVYIQDCKDMGIEILNPSINESETKFIVVDNKIRFGLGSVKNVGVAVIDSIVLEREKNGPYESFTSFCERIKDSSVNKKCIESLIKAGAFDEFGKNRATLLASFETILDTINNENKNKIENQVSMFDLMNEEESEKIETQKYSFIEKEEMETRELLSLEKEMLGVYISGHPLDKIRVAIERQANISSLDFIKINEEIEEFGETRSFKDGQNVKFVGIISKINKKFTRKNTTMAFINIEDFYGNIEVIVFDTVYSKTSNFLVEDNIILVEGKISIREDEPAKIVATSIKEFSEDIQESNIPLNQVKTLQINITDINEMQKSKLRGAIKFFSGDRVNMKIEILDGEQIKPCGAIFLTDRILEVFENIVSKENVKLI